MKRILCSLLLLAVIPAIAADYSVQPGSTLGFSGTFQGEAFNGEFKKFDATISYDPAKLAASKFDVSIDIGSVATGDSDRDNALPGDEFFDTVKFPKAHFVSKAFRKDGDKVIADGTLTIKGISKPVSLEVGLTPSVDGATLTVTTNLDRSDFSIGTGDYADTSTIGAVVTVNGKLKLAAK
ncbi:MAG: YceI family protein [Dokdonella sp.]